MFKNLELSQALSARLCHDLAGAIGTIDNCLSLLDNSNTAIKEKAKSLLTEESSNLVYKIKFFRSAYGLSDGENEMSIIFLTKLLKDFFLNTDIKLTLQFQEGLIFLESTIAKATMCLAVIASENINSFGVLNLHINDGSMGIKVIANGKDIKLKDKNEMIFYRKKSSRLPINVSNCREHYINDLCSKNGYQISVIKKGGLLEYNMQKKN